MKRVLKDIDRYADKIKEMVLNETFEPSEYKYETRVEYGKERRLQKPKFYPDQIIHHILIMLIRPNILKRIDPYAIASIEGRGSRVALKKIPAWLKQKSAKYAIKGDIRKCFDNIKPKYIMQMYERMIKDPKYLKLKAKVVYSTESLPLGNYCSAYDVNMLLKGMDETIRAQDGVHHYIRYMDDFIVVFSNKRKAKKLRAIIQRELDKIELTIKSNYQLFKVRDRGIDFIGYRFFRDYTILRRRNLANIYKQAAKLSKKIIITPKESMSITSRLGMCRHCQSKEIYKRIGRILNLHKVKEVIRHKEGLVYAL